MDPLTKEIMIKLLVAAVLGIVVGFERWYKSKPAGIRTYALVAMGSALFTILSVRGFGAGTVAFDPSRIAAQVVVGIGFIGAGLIFLRGGSVQGLTTAAGIWVSAAIGMASALGFYSVAVYTAIMTLVILWGVRFLEAKMYRPPKDHAEQPEIDD